MATVSFELEFSSGGFQQVLNSGGTRALVDSTADGIVARTGGLAYRRSFTGTAGTPRPLATVFAHGSRNPIVQMATNHRLEGAI